MVNPSINEREPKLDRLQLVALAVLMLIGTLFIYSATMAITASSEARAIWVFINGHIFPKIRTSSKARPAVPASKR